MTELLAPAPYDAAAFGMPAWELAACTPEALRLADATPGLQTIKVDPLADKALLEQHGFHYCDTLLGTRATPAQLRAPAPRAGLPNLPNLPNLPHLHIALAPDPQRTLAICHGAFEHGRFHRDYALPRAGADLRYDNWLRQLLAAGTVYGLYRDDVLSGFIGYHGATLVLHAVAPECRGQGLAKHWWHQAAEALFRAGQPEVRSSISAANLAVLNLYASLGFSFQHPQDIYHRIVP
jgi:ribosomal protein S18 acetylase RimI-like enzyme